MVSFNKCMAKSMALDICVVSLYLIPTEKRMMILISQGYVLLQVKEFFITKTIVSWIFKQGLIV